MTILITGGAGYIGSHTCIELLNAGHDIIVVDNFSNSKPEALKRVSEITRKYFRTYCLDLQNREGLEKVFTDNEIEAVIHFAGFKAVGESVHFPLKYYENNMNSTITLCEVMKKFHVNKLVFSSSATVYGVTDTVPITEESPLKATNPYGRTKQMIEELLQDLYDSDREWSIALLRYFNPVGAHESGRIGEDPNGIPNNLMPYISQVAIGKLEKLQVYGDDYPTVDGTGVRDYIHVVDLGLGHVKALERMLTTRGIDAYNLGTGKGYSVLEVLSAYEKAAGKTIPYTVVEKRPGDVAVCYADTSKAKEKLNWEAVKGIDEMCKDSWRWQQHNPFGYEKQSKMLVKN
ncbi:UDP-glucose 4-epimerase GalE [Rossellomorea vietnamensis]|uniref:UDP-glucose 4-epimerase GalE n=1 Tax=Rossellomorea vietnamensis TaxID=218284 RepID=A0ACD4C2C8_9BACI|nr:UDP-glucose 4-epimerase GalE [Rossellomorea vietnamensis]UXH42765.1 UDP-glucose 4-epimerase GalE [Rossellomorea vietnamensis]